MPLNGCTAQAAHALDQLLQLVLKHLRGVRKGERPNQIVLGAEEQIAHVAFPIARVKLAGGRTRTNDEHGTRRASYHTPQDEPMSRLELTSANQNDQLGPVLAGEAHDLFGYVTSDEAYPHRRSHCQVTQVPGELMEHPVAPGRPFVMRLVDVHRRADAARLRGWRLPGGH